MNAKYLIAPLGASLASAGAFAAAATAATGVTRAQVVAELAQARANGVAPLSEANFLQYQLAAAPVTREKVPRSPSAAGRSTAPRRRSRPAGPACH